MGFIVAGGPGFEPGLFGSEPKVLPLNYPPAGARPTGVVVSALCRCALKLSTGVAGARDGAPPAQGRPLLGVEKTHPGKISRRPAGRPISDMLAMIRRPSNATTLRESIDSAAESRRYSWLVLCSSVEFPAPRFRVRQEDERKSAGAPEGGGVTWWVQGPTDAVGGHAGNQDVASRRLTPRSTWARTTAGCLWRGRRGKAFASSTRFRASCAWVRACMPAAVCRTDAIDRTIEALHVCAGKMRPARC